ncbi:MAG: dihydrolipoamide acetyltransferase family protein [Gemmataceae bacterium]
MAIPITVPRLGWSMEEGTFVQWLRADGEAVRPGDPLFTLEGEKSTESVEAIDEGILRLGAEAPRDGDRVKVGQVIGYIAQENESAPAPGPVTTAATPPIAGPAVRRLARSLGVDLHSVAGSGPGGRVVEQDLRPAPAAPSLAAAAPSPVEPAATKRAITPRARRRAQQLGIAWENLPGSGKNGRIRERDIQAPPAGAPGGKRIPHTSTRKTIAARMVAGVTQAAPVTLMAKVDATRLVQLREQFRAAPGDRALLPSFTDLLLKLTAVTLRRHPMLQAQWEEQGLYLPDGIHLGLAVDTEAGLLVPVLHDADQLTLRQTMARARELTEQARKGQLRADQMRGGTFTLSNLGMYGVDAFTPILNLPQSAVLGIGRIVREPAVHENAVVVREVVALSLTFDHRVVDGAPAARFLGELRQAIENPAPLLIP